MTGVAAMLGLAVILLQLLMKLDADSRSRFDAANSLARLARQFRQDVHAAGSPGWTPKRAVLRLEAAPDRAIEYQLKGDDKVVRVETGKGTQVRRESVRGAEERIDPAVDERGRRRRVRRTDRRPGGRQEPDRSATEIRDPGPGGQERRPGSRRGEGRGREAMKVTSTRSTRRGLTAVAVLVCLVIVTMVSGVLLKVGLAHRDQVRSHEHRLQAEWLAQSGLDRAVTRLAADHGYSGETWKLTHRDLGLPEIAGPAEDPAAVIAIKVEPAGSPVTPHARSSRSRPIIPPISRGGSRHSTQIQVELNSLKTGASR